MGTLNVLIIDDAVVYRKVISGMVGSFPEIESTSTAASADIALLKMEQKSFDLVLCDIHMPGKSGIQTLDEILRRFPQTTVVMMSSVSNRTADITMQALKHGALDFIKKPDSNSIEQNSEEFKKNIRAMLNVVMIRRESGPMIPITKKIPSVDQQEDFDKRPRLPSLEPFAIAVIGISTGGPEALMQIVPALPSDIPVPILIVQHMPPLFTHSLAESLDKISNLHVIEAQDNQQITAGTIYFAPGGVHSTVRKKPEGIVVSLNDNPPENNCRPSVDVLFRSVASVYENKNILAMILTGMGTDGLCGVQALKRNKCYCITQSAGSCIVYGMPRAVDESGLSDESISLDHIAPRITQLLKIK